MKYFVRCLAYLSVIALSSAAYAASCSPPHKSRHYYSRSCAPVSKCHNTTSESLPDRAIVTRTIASPAPFTSLRVGAGINVVITDAEGKPSITAKGDLNTVSRVHVDVCNQILRLSMNRGRQVAGRRYLTVTINVPQLHTLIVDGQGTVTSQYLKKGGPAALLVSGSSSVFLKGRDMTLCQIQSSGQSYIQVDGLKTPLLNVQQSGSGNIVLRGDVVLQQVNYTGDGTLDLYWVNSNYVRVKASGRSQIRLAGIASLLDVTLTQGAFLNARDLRAEKGFINTEGHARADVSVKKVLGSLASGESDIYYYHDSDYVGGYMRGAGAVLRMNGIK